MILNYIRREQQRQSKVIWSTVSSPVKADVRKPHAPGGWYLHVRVRLHSEWRVARNVVQDDAVRGCVLQW